MNIATRIFELYAGEPTTPDPASDYNRNMPNAVKTALLLGAMSALLLFLGESLGGAQGLVIGFLFAVVTNFASYWFSDKIVLSMYRATQVGPDHRLYRIVASLAQRAGLPMPRVYVIPQPSPNAFATGRNPNHAAVAATEGILQMLSDAELEGVIAHELAHVKHRDILISSVAATLAAAIMMIARFAMFFGGRAPRRSRGGNPIAALATIILAPLAAMLIQAAISRSREFDADAGGASIVGSPMGLVSALRKIESASRAVPHRRQPGDGSHVHHQAVLARRAAVALQHASADRRTDRSVTAQQVIRDGLEPSPPDSLLPPESDLLGLGGGFRAPPGCRSSPASSTRIDPEALEPSLRLPFGRHLAGISSRTADRNAASSPGIRVR